MLKLKPHRERPGYCGPASLKMVLEFFGVEETEERLGRLAKTSARTGTTAENIVRAAKVFGLKGRIKEMASVSDIRHFVNKKKIPVIVDWFSETDGHYSVVVGADDKNIYMQDPELGDIRAMTMHVFRRVWFDFRGPYLKRAEDLLLRRLIIIEPR